MLVFLKMPRLAPAPSAPAPAPAPPPPAPAKKNVDTASLLAMTLVGVVGLLVGIAMGILLG